ncbi:hypothetical protein CHLRE_12g559550v5 [Chlamydomonas reinhardtii]|uniref:Uncharacterized protein n=1 Tax=Chlamydomonas reinhardtii TaxID=3055 RepID=A0A2K3D5K1_CHLRE|nr:uncharacterized protein CHLRE_12g559700v5 [Chlamydomonas reinhardtii]XP_042918850.1 uncharacterized protein CHLRE_12g559550v5 [Chlamydomonas reinhardtii]PNW75808.1 hypothetical protein CHLRE_12g559700v5 [Chlamydomonas reinhardtii]PNW75813.1 hypothetical protein CHLRE_12g559550v5 [Chlamydomonas reinhardtii]
MMLAKTRASIAPRARARIVVVRLGRVSILCRAWPWPGRDKPSAPSTSPPAADVTMVLTVVGSCLTLFSALYMALAGLKAEISSDMTDFKKELRADLRQAEDRWYTVSRDTATLKAVSDARTPPPPPSPKQEKQPDQQQQ